jgi:transcriptional regulator with XRE-family HTH domain
VALQLIVAHNSTGVDVGETRFDITHQFLSLFFRQNEVLGEAIADHSTKDEEVVVDLLIVVSLENGGKLIDGHGPIALWQHANRPEIFAHQFTSSMHRVPSLARQQGLRDVDQSVAVEPELDASPVEQKQQPLTVVVGRGYVSELERGTVVPTIGTLAKVAKALQVGLVDLVAVTGTPREELLDATRELSETNIKAVLRTVPRRWIGVCPARRSGWQTS